jgi:hypothetical protein
MSAQNDYFLIKTAVWVMPPNSSTCYSRLKRMAQEMGYQTVEYGHIR